jgi:uncharacterized protein (DUF58 family)
MTAELAREFSYHIGWRSRGRRPGRHAGVQRGLGVEFRGHAPLIAYPDPRRIDLRQTLRDPFDQVFVRIYNQKSAIPVHVICDLSGSMGFSGQRSKMELASEITAAVAYSAFRVGDPFGFIGFDEKVREDWLFTSTTKVYAAFELAKRLGEHRPAKVGAGGLLDAGYYLARERSLVFLISDFHMPLDMLKTAVNGLARHQLVPIVLWDAAEYRHLPDFGIASVIDCETGTRRTLLFREGLRQRIEQAFADRRSKLEQFFMGFDTPPFFVENAFDPDALTEYFYQFFAA